jgi:hypothetical protein
MEAICERKGVRYVPTTHALKEKRVLRLPPAPIFEDRSAARWATPTLLTLSPLGRTLFWHCPLLLVRRRQS